MTTRRVVHRPVEDEWSWQLRAACRDASAATFFHPDHERGHAREDRDEQAKAVRARCPVIVECRRHALTAEEPYGVWGGQDETERRLAITRRRRSGHARSASCCPALSTTARPA
jgi:WhiB family redox-sensing transcriptional regulator